MAGHLMHSAAWLEYKAINSGQPLFGQLEARLESETLRHAQRLSQGLDQKRQQAIGIRKYVWRTRGDAKVRTAHAVNDGKIFEWRNPPATGHPGEDFNCRCWAEPSLDGAGDPYIEPADEVQVAGLGKVVIEIIRRVVAKRAARQAAERAAREAARKPKPKPSKEPQPKLDDTITWPSPPKQSKYKEGEPSRIKPHARGEKSLYDEDGGEWRYSPEDKYHNPHWDYKPAGKTQEWQNVPIENLPVRK